MTLLLALLLSAASVTPDIQRLAPAVVQELVKKGDAVIIDVRGSVPFELGHVRGAVWMPLGKLSERAGELPEEKLVVAYCTCKAEETSLEAARLLASYGFKRVAVMVGGYPAWVEAGLPTASNRAPATAPAGSAAAASSGKPGSRLAPPAGVPCAREELTVYSGPVTGWTREGERTTVTVRTGSESSETVTLRHAANDARFFLFEGSPFLPRHWERIESKPGSLRPGMAANVWVCRDGGVLVDWRPAGVAN